MKKLDLTKCQMMLDGNPITVPIQAPPTVWEKTFWMSAEALARPFRTWGSKETVTLGDPRARFPVKVVGPELEETKICKVKTIHASEAGKVLVTIQEVHDQ